MDITAGLPKNVSIGCGSCGYQVSKMRCRKFRVLLIVMLLFGCFVPVSGGIGNTSLCLPQQGAFWLGVHPPVQYHATEMDVTNSSIASFARAVGKKPAIVVFSHEWGVNKSFPSKQFAQIYESGATPWVRLMLRSDIHQNKPEPLFTMSRILNGAYDAELRNWAVQVKNLGYPVIVEYGTEVNGKWFPWNGYWTGNTHGAEKFRETYRHIFQVLEKEGASNLIRVYHVNWHSDPDESWNTIAAYYPGDEFVDIIGVSVYGALTPNEKNVKPFSEMMDLSYQEIVALNTSKPIIIAETGTDINNEYINSVVWTKDALMNLSSGRWPGVIGIVWWNSAWPNDSTSGYNTSMRVEEDSTLQELLHNLIGNDSRFVNKTDLTC